MGAIVGVAVRGREEFGVAGGRVGWGAARPRPAVLPGSVVEAARAVQRVRGGWPVLKRLRRMAAAALRAVSGVGSANADVARASGDAMAAAARARIGCGGVASWRRRVQDARPSRRVAQGDAVGLCERVERDARLEVVGEQRGEPR